MKTIFSLVLAVLSLLNASSGATLGAAESGEFLPSSPAVTDPGDPDGADPLSAPAPTETDYGDMTYFHYDAEYFSARADRLAELARNNDAEAVNALYDELYQEFLRVDSLASIAMLRHDADYNNEYWAEEYAYAYSLWEETWDMLLTACGEVLDSPCARSFSAHIGQDTAGIARGYGGWDAEAAADSARELELVDEYLALQETLDYIPFSYEGETWDMDRLYGFPGASLSRRDYSAYWAIYIGLQEAITREFSPLYIELVQLWTEEARSYGYSSYVDYAYAEIYGRDYTPEDAQRFCDAVKPLAREYYADLYYSDLAFGEDLVSPVLSPEELLDTLGEYLPRIDPVLLEPWEQMTEHGLYDMAGYAPGRYGGAYTTNLTYWHSPFLFATLSEDCFDLITLTHEFGHFSDFWFNPMTNVITQVDDLDLSEIHSNALQALFTSFYDEIYDRGADVARFINLAYLLENIFDGCLYDEFQRRVLEEPDDLTPEKLNRLYTQVCAEYGLYDEQEWDAGWVYIDHNFQYPLYYISYAASTMAALQIWDMAQEDFDGAVDAYLQVLRCGAHDQGYFQVLEECRLRSFREEGAVESVCRPVLELLTEIDRTYR